MTPSVPVFTKFDLPADGWEPFRKKVITPMTRIVGPFTVITKEGPLTCQDGYLALDTEGFPYPISCADQLAMYGHAPEGDPNGTD